MAAFHRLRSVSSSPFDSGQSRAGLSRNHPPRLTISAYTPCALVFLPGLSATVRAREFARQVLLSTRCLFLFCLPAGDPMAGFTSKWFPRDRFFPVLQYSVLAGSLRLPFLLAASLTPWIVWPLYTLWLAPFTFPPYFVFFFGCPGYFFVCSC